MHQTNYRARLPAHSAPNHNHNHNHNYNPVHLGKQLMSFQNYVRTLSNAVDENTAFKKYRDFLADLSQSKVGRFFEANKDKEWFKLRYHPIENQKTLEEINKNFLKRLKAFNDFNDRNIFDHISFNNLNAQLIINLINAINVRLEDGPQELVEQLISSADIKPDVLNRYVPSQPTSIVIDDVSIETTLSEIQDICLKASPELKRIAAVDPYYVKGGQLKRKFIAIYDRGVDIKDICWKVSRTRLNGRQLNVSVNKVISNRIQTVDAISNHRVSVVNDIRQAIILILNFDEFRGLSGKRKQILEENPQNVDLKTAQDTVIKMETDADPDEISAATAVDNVAPLSPPGSERSGNDEDEEKPFNISTLDEEREKEKRKLLEFKFNIDMSLYRIVGKLSKNKNPLLENAHLYMIEFTESAGTNYFLSKVPPSFRGEVVSSIDLDRNESDRLYNTEQIVRNLNGGIEDDLKYLDKLLWYLRIVHSFDYYKKVIYRQEDELTLRLGVVHVRDDPAKMPEVIDNDALIDYLRKSHSALEEFSQSQSQKYVTKDEERFNYKSYGKVITDELTSYSQRIQKPKSYETEEVYKCKHCTKVFQKLTDIGRHFVGKHRWAIDAIELETDYFNTYLFDCNKINPCPPKELLEFPPNRFTRLTTFSQMGEDPDLLQQTIEAYSKMDSFVREPAPRAQVDSDPRNDTIVDYTDISFDDAI